MFFITFFGLSKNPVFPGNKGAGTGRKFFEVYKLSGRQAQFFPKKGVKMGGCKGQHVFLR